MDSSVCIQLVNPLKKTLKKSWHSINLLQLSAIHYLSGQICQSFCYSAKREKVLPFKKAVKHTEYTSIWLPTFFVPFCKGGEGWQKTNVISLTHQMGQRLKHVRSMRLPLCVKLFFPSWWNVLAFTFRYTACNGLPSVLPRAIKKLPVFTLILAGREQ